MDKRSFIKFLSAIVAGPIVSPLFAKLPDSKLKNWAGNLEYSTENLYSATSVDQVRQFIKTQKKLKVLGTRHCFNKIADSANQFLSYKAPEEVISLDPQAHTVTVAAGVTYGHLSPYLDSKGFALHNLASLPHISVAGSCSTATHGSGDKNGNLATAVSALEIVTAAGEVGKMFPHRGGEAFLGGAVGVGGLGVIVKGTLDIQATYIMRQYVYENLPLSAVREHFDGIESSGLFTDWQNQRINEVWIKSRVEVGQGF